MEFNFGAKVKEIRIEKGLKQSYVSSEIGYKSPSMLSEIESGKKSLDVSKIPRLAEVLDVNIEQLFFDKNVHNSRTIECDEK
ncbi:helix-turn-helix transcriptional regulator [Alkalibacillus silvisoli]|uniref:HTH cro/C1-type domain-containing protein n=1 Tax=Alkalibacillus silvisoli TaxID=392823 RepID=A0ABN1AAK5_9BACI